MKGWKRESARHALARKGIKTGIKQKYKYKFDNPKIPILIRKSTLSKEYPIAFSFVDSFVDADDSKILKQIKIIFAKARYDEFGGQSHVAAKSYPKTKHIIIYTKHPTFKKIDKRNTRQNSAIVHEIIHILQNSREQKLPQGVSRLTIKQWKVFSDEQLPIYFEKKFEKAVTKSYITADHSYVDYDVALFKDFPQKYLQIKKVRRLND